MTTQPGWHPDPAPQQPGQPAQLRWWDGTRWTEHTAPVPGQQAGSTAYPASAYGPAQGGVRTTPDGVPLAGWWIRVLAYVIDSFLVFAIASVVAFPAWRDIAHDFRHFLDTADATTANGGTPDTAEFQRQIQGPIWAVSLVTLAVGFAYHVGLLLWRQGTLGMMAVGIRVRLRERPGRMPVGTVLLRWLTQYGVGALGVVPVVGILASIYALLDDLWPLWDDKKQAIHDKVAKTNVVKVRR